MRNRPCPVCSAPDGFHDDGPHSTAREAIPAELRRPSNSALRRERRAEEHLGEMMDMDRRQDRALQRRFLDGIRPHLPRTLEEDLVERELAIQYARDQRGFFEGAEGRKLLADMAAALMTPDAPHLDR